MRGGLGSHGQVAAHTDTSVCGVDHRVWMGSVQSRVESQSGRAYGEVRSLAEIAHNARPTWNSGSWGSARVNIHAFRHSEKFSSEKIYRCASPNPIILVSSECWHFCTLQVSKKDASLRIDTCSLEVDRYVKEVALLWRSFLIWNEMWIPFI